MCRTHITTTLKELEKENARLKKMVADLLLDKEIIKEFYEVISSKRARVLEMKEKYSERRICRAVRLSRSVMKYQCITRDDENEIETKIIELATEFGEC